MGRKADINRGAFMAAFVIAGVVGIAGAGCGGAIVVWLIIVLILSALRIIR